MTISRVAHTTTSGLGDSTSGAINTTGATFLIAAVSFNTGGSITVSDSKSNTWTALSTIDPGAGAATRLYYVANPTVGSGHTFTVAGGIAASMAVAAFSGVTTTSPLSAGSDVGHFEGTGSPASVQAGSITPTQNNCLIICAVGQNRAATPAIDSSMTISDHVSFTGGDHYGIDLAWKQQGTAAAINPAWSNLNDEAVNAVAAAFKDDGSGGTPLVVGTASLTSASATTISLSAGSASGGTAPYGYQWYRSTTANFTIGGGNILSGATSATLNDSSSLSADTIYFYKCLVSDSNGSPGSNGVTNQVAGALKAATIKLGFIGDSITAGYGLTDSPTKGFPEYMAEMLRSVYKQRDVTIVNRGIPAWKAQDWAADTSSSLTNAKAAFASASVTHVLIMLGANDAASHRTSTQFGTDLDTIITSLTGSGYTVVLNYPTYIPAGANSNATDEAATENLRTYLAVIDGKISGTSVLRGDTIAYQYFADHQDETQTDQTHPTDVGHRSLATMQARAFDRVVLQASSGGGASLLGGFTS